MTASKTKLTCRAISKILSNAYKFIEADGCVEIYVDYAPGQESDGLEIVSLLSVPLQDDLTFRLASASGSP